MKHEARMVYGGVDTHSQVHVAAVIDMTGTLLGTKSFPTSPLGLRGLERWLTRHGSVAKIGVEGTGTYGLGLTRVLQDAGHEVVEVNRPNRQTRRSRGKSDTIDAESAARAVLGGHANATPKAHDGIVESIRVLLMAHRSARRNSDRVGGQLRALVVTAPESLRVEFAAATTATVAGRAAKFRPGQDCSDVTTATKTTMRILARQYLALNDDLKTIEHELEILTTKANPGLRQVHGVGPIVAARLLTAAGDNPERMRTDAGFAALCGVSPVPASSGKTTAMRLNRGGNRDANAALHRIVLVRMSTNHADTKDYVERRTAEGMPKRSIIRCLKRFVAREIHGHLIHPKPAVQTDDLRARRQAIGQPLRTVADALGAHIMSISCLERGTNHDRDLAQRYRSWIQQQEVAS